MTISTMACLAAGQRGLHVALEQRGEGLLVLPLGMLRRERLDAVEREEELEVHRLLGPERAVVVEGGDALGRRHEVRRAFLRHLLDESDDGLLRRGRRSTTGAGRLRVATCCRTQSTSEQPAATRRWRAWLPIFAHCAFRTWLRPHRGANGPSRRSLCAQYLPAPPASCSFSSTWSSEKLPGFCRGGNSW